MLFVVQLKTGSALSLLSVIYIRAEATYRIMEAAVPLRRDKFSAEKLPFFSFFLFFLVRYLIWIYSALGNALAAWIKFSVL